MITPAMVLAKYRNEIQIKNFHLFFYFLYPKGIILFFISQRHNTVKGMKKENNQNQETEISHSLKKESIQTLFRCRSA